VFFIYASLHSSFLQARDERCILVQKPEGKRPLEREDARIVDPIKMDLKRHKI
jgi:hypothetical protein